MTRQQKLTPPPSLCRCAWAGTDPAMRAYHDQEWGVPIHDDRRLFEFLILEGAQAGLSWSTILNKRQGYRQAFNEFDPAVVAGYSDRHLVQLRTHPGIVKNRLKINAARTNARAFLAIRNTFGSFDRFIWSFVQGQPVQNQFKREADIPSCTEISRAMADDLKKRGFIFVGPTICYAFMQAVGMVNDHVTGCFRHDELGEG